MANISATKMSSKGQMVIPEAIRKKLGLKSGDQFVVTGSRDIVVLKSISPLSLDEFDDLIAEARRQDRKAGMKRTDIKSALAKVRGKK